MTKKEKTVRELLETVGLMPTVAGSVIPIGGLAGIPAGAATAGSTNVWSNSDDLIGDYREKLKAQKS